MDEPDGSPDLSNGRPVNYSDVGRNQHREHIHLSHNEGGWLRPGLTMAHNNTDEPEAVDPL